MNTAHTHSSRAIIGTLVIITIACSTDTLIRPDDGFSVTPTPAINSVAIVDQFFGIALGDTRSVVAIVRDVSNTIRTDQPAVWRSSDSSVVSVSATDNTTATITALAQGSVTISVATNGHSAVMHLFVTSDQAFVYSISAGITPIPMPSGVVQSRATAINDAGQVVGYFSFGVSPGGAHAFIWSPSDGLLDLGVPPGANINEGDGAVASAINANGDVTGGSGGSETASHAFVWNKSTGMIDLGTLPNASGSYGTGINSKGDIVGYGTVGSSVRPFIWSKSTGMRLIGSLADSPAAANAINDDGTIVGTTTLPGTPDPLTWIDGVTWNPDGTITNLTQCEVGSGCSAKAISRAGVVTGMNARGEAYLWSAAGGMQSVGAFRAEGSAINDLGQIAGNANDANRGAFFWSTATGRINIGVLPRRSVSYATGINNKGQVVGYSR